MLKNGKNKNRINYKPIQSYYLTLCKSCLKIKKVDSLKQDVELPHYGDKKMVQTFSARLLFLDVIVFECREKPVQCSFIHICSFVRQINVSRINVLRINNHFHISKDIVSILPTTVHVCDFMHTMFSLSKYYNKFVHFN